LIKNEIKPDRHYAGPSQVLAASMSS